MKRCEWKICLKPETAKATEPGVEILFICPQCKDEVLIEEMNPVMAFRTCPDEVRLLERLLPGSSARAWCRLLFAAIIDEWHDTIYLDEKIGRKRFTETKHVTELIANRLNLSSFFKSDAEKGEKE